MDSQTPYDITDIPLFPFVPGVIWWAIVLAIALIVAIAIGRVPLRRARKVSSAFEVALHELQAISNSKLPIREILSQASLVTRRLITALSAVNARSATATEMKALSKGATPELSQVFNLAAEVERLRFSHRVTHEDINALLTSLMTEIERSRKRLQQPEVS